MNWGWQKAGSFELQCQNCYMIQADGRHEHRYCITRAGPVRWHCGVMLQHTLHSQQLELICTTPCVCVLRGKLGPFQRPNVPFCTALHCTVLYCTVLYCLLSAPSAVDSVPRQGL
jgi:hypothetical protein